MFYHLLSDVCNCNISNFLACVFVCYCNLVFLLIYDVFFCRNIMYLDIFILDTSILLLVLYCIFYPSIFILFYSFVFPIFCCSSIIGLLYIRHISVLCNNVSWLRRLLHPPPAYISKYLPT